MDDLNDNETNDEKTLKDIDISMFPTQYQNVPSLFPANEVPMGGHTNFGLVHDMLNSFEKKLFDKDDDHLFKPQPPPPFFDRLSRNPSPPTPVNFNGMSSLRISCLVIRKNYFQTIFLK